MRAIISRFAPAPTGFLHLGHVVNAVFVWGVTKARGGQVLLRIEDHDRQRRRPAFDAAILEDLEWLGFAPDQERVRQSARVDLYRDGCHALSRQGLVYACSCARSNAGRPDVTRSVQDWRAENAGPSNGAELRYPGTCRDRGLADAPGLGLRVHLEPSVERFTDLRHGPQEQSPAEQCGDVLIRDRSGSWTYQFAATVDDYAQGVTLVIRGDDLLASAGRQLQLARLLGRTDMPDFLHHPLVMKSPAQKLSKSDGDSGVRDLRASGWSAAQVIARAAALAGLQVDESPLSAADVPALFASRPID